MRSAQKDGRRTLLVSFASILLLLTLSANIIFLRYIHHPTTTIVAQSGPGRLGNQLFQYASALGISHQMDVAFCVSAEHPFPFETIFQGPFPTCESQKLATFLPEAGYGIYTNFQIPFCFYSSCYIHVGPYLQSFKYLDPEIPSTLHFLPAIQDEANKVIQTLRQSNTIMVGIHVRRGDVAWVEYLHEAPASYFAHAMEFYRHKYGTVTFVVASDDMDWCQDQHVFRATDMVHSTTSAVDLAILSLCDHLIISVGTFGWFAAKFAGGDVVYYQDAIVLDHPINMGQILLQDYYPPEWIPMR